MSNPAAPAESSNWPVFALVLTWITADSSTLQAFQGQPGGALANAVFIFGAGASIGVHELVGAACRRRLTPLAAAILAMVSNLPLAVAMLVAARMVYLAPGPDAVVGALAALVSLNIAFFATNLLPALPFDGGRIVSAAVSRKPARAQLAARLTAACTEGVGWLFLVFGLASALADGPSAGLIWLLIAALVLQDGRLQRRRLAAIDATTPSHAATSSATPASSRKVLEPHQDSLPHSAG